MLKSKVLKLPNSLKTSIFCAIVKKWKQNLPLNCTIFDVFLPDVSQLRSHQHRQYVHVTEREVFFHQFVANEL